MALRWAPLLSSEPGYYRDGEFGIRIEDIALVVEAQTKVTPAPLPEGPGAASSPQPPFPGLCIRLGGHRGGRGGLGTALGWRGPLLCSHHWTCSAGGAAPGKEQGAPT